MALSRIVYPSDGSTVQFSIPFALGYINQSDIKCQVNGEVDGGNQPIYRALTFNTPTLVTVAGTPGAAGPGLNTVFTRTVADDELIVDYEDGAVINEDNLNTAQKQALMLVHQVLDGRFDTFLNDINMGGFKLINLGDPTDPTDGANKAYVDSVVATGAANAAAAAASAAASAASAGASASSASNAAASETNSANSAAASQASRLASEAARDLSLTYRNNAFKWASEAFNVPVNDGTNSGFSAYHWSVVAQTASQPVETQIGAAASVAIADGYEFGFRQSPANTLGRRTWAQLKANIFGTANSWTATQTHTGNIVIGGSANINTSIELGNQTTGGSAFIDFHSSNPVSDYNARIIATGGTGGVSGDGNISFEWDQTVGVAIATALQTVFENSKDKLMTTKGYWAGQALNTTQNNVSGNLSINFAASPSHYLLLNGNAVLNASVGAKSGQVVTLRIYNPATYTVGFNASVYKTAGNWPITTFSGHSYFTLFVDPTDGLILITPTSRG